MVSRKLFKKQVIILCGKKKVTIESLDINNIMNVIYLCAGNSSGAYGGVEDL